MFFQMFLWCVCVALCGHSLATASPITLGKKPSIRSLQNGPFSKITITSPLNGKSTTITELLNRKQSIFVDPSKAKNNFLLLFFTHLGDLSSFELAQKVSYYLPQIEESNIEVIGMTPCATEESAKLFCEKTQFPLAKLYIDKDAALYKELNFERGFQPDADLSPYLKLLPMLAGVGSPGTIGEVIRGYTGDKYARSAWIRKTLRLVEQDRFDVLGGGYQRPFELATLRLQNMIDVLQNWDKLAPENKNMLTQLGGALVVNRDGCTVKYEHRDPGILKYVNLQAALNAVGIELKE